jgi:ribosomal protein L37AE/L43A
MNTFANFGIEIPAHASGNVRCVCPQCSAGRKKSRDKCLSVNVTTGVWLCQHCGFKGTLKQRKPYARTSAARYSQNAIDGALKIIRASERGEKLEPAILAKSKAIIQAIPPHARTMSYKAQQAYNDLILKMTVISLADYKPKVTLCDGCGNPFDQNDTFPGSWHCMRCHAKAAR